MPDTAMRADARWRPQEQLSLPPLVRDWLADPGSLTARLRLYGACACALVAPTSSHTRPVTSNMTCVNSPSAPDERAMNGCPSSFILSMIDCTSGT